MGEGTRLTTGDRIGDYRIEIVLKRGPSGELCGAAHVVLPRVAAIRVAPPGTADAGVRLLREACIVEALGHPGVPRMYDCGRLADRRPWIATERVDGTVLAEAITGGALAAGAVAALIRDVAAILEHAHRRGVVHRAVSPDTILVTAATERGWPVCLCDWSEARTLDASPEPHRTGPHDAPEAGRGDGYAGAIDVYALGVVAFEVLSGARRPEGAPPLGMVADQVTRLLGRRGPVTAATGQLAWLLDDMLAFDAARRPSAAAIRVIASQIADEIEREQADTTDLAVAMLAVEEIALSDSEIALSDSEIETIATDPDPDPDTAPVPVPAAPEVSEAPQRPTPPTQPIRIPSTAVGPPLPPPRPGPAVLARLRSPKWTPSTVGRISSDQAAAIVGEINVDDGPPRRKS